MVFWRKIWYGRATIKKLGSQRRNSSSITVTVISSALILLLFSSCILNPISPHFLLKAEAKPFYTTSLLEKKYDLKTNLQGLAKKLREATGEKIPNDYIVVLKDNNFLSSVSSLAGEAKSEGAALGHIYDHVGVYRHP